MRRFGGQELRVDTPLCSWCARAEHEVCQRANRVPCPCECRNPSFLSHYSLRSEVACWLIARAPEIVAAGPSTLYAHDRPPRCPRVVDGEPCGAPMRLRPGFWKCFLHGDEPVAIKVRPEYERAPEGDALRLVIASKPAYVIGRK